MNVLQMDLILRGWKIIFAGVKQAVSRTKFVCLCTEMTEGPEMLPICKAVEINVLYFGI
jgi:hypothetical protein